MTFDSLIGNPQAKQILQQMISDSCVPSTLIFSGPKGVGKSLFAKGFIASLMGPSHAIKVAASNHPDLHIYTPEGKSAIHTSEQIHHLIHEATLPPFEASVKVFLIEEAHQMLPSSSNALLKTLEEPLPDTYFLLLTHAIHEILPTICSRARKIPFLPIPKEQIQTFIHTQWKKKEEEARKIAFQSHGSLGKAKKIAEHPPKWRQILIEVLSLHPVKEYPQLFLSLNDLEKQLDLDGKEEETSFVSLCESLLEEIVAWYRDLHLLQANGKLYFLYHLDALDQLRLRLTRQVPPLEQIIHKVLKLQIALHRHVKLRAALEHFLLDASI